MPDADAANADARMTAIEGQLAKVLNLLENQIPPAAPVPDPSLAAPAPDPGPGFFHNAAPATKSVLRPNPPFVFDGDRTQGRAFLHAVRTYARLVPEAFAEGAQPSEEKLVRYAMSFMAKDSAQRWAERHSSKEPFPFPTWDSFVTEFRLRFVEENEQDHALLKLESRAYHMGVRDVFKYTDDFEDLVDLAGFSDPIIKVAKYRTGLDPAINFAITGSSDPPPLTDYLAWRSRAYRQYESTLRSRGIPAPARTSTAVPARAFATTGRAPAMPGRIPVQLAAPAPAPRANPPLPPPVPMDVDRARARTGTRRGCYRCGDPNHFARDCTAPVDVRSADVLDEVIQQLGDEMLEELLARLASTRAAVEHSAEVGQGDFPSRDE